MKLKNSLILLILLFAFKADAQQILCIENSGNDFNITWSLPTAPCGPFISYEIWVANDPSAAFSLVTTITTETQTNFTHVDAIISIGDPLYYYIIYSYNCPGIPPLISEVATSDFGSFQPEITSIDVNNSGIEICWEESDFIQTAGYVISYLLPNGLALPFDTVIGIQNLCYSDVISNVNDPNLVYTLIYLDGCNNFSQYNPIGYQIMQVVSEQQGCNQLIEYEWENYNNPYNLDFSYNIYIQINDGPIDLVANQPGNQNIFNLFDFIDQDTIAMRVEVIDENGIPRTNSPWLIDTAQIVQPPREFYLNYLSVENDTFIDIDFYIDELANLRNIDIDTSKLGGSFDGIERYAANLFPGLGNLSLPDTISPPYNAPRFYRLTANDSCNTDHFSTIGKTIFVEAELNDFFKNIAKWNAFELEDAVVSSYRLYRDFGVGLQLVQSFSPSSSFEYIDDVSAFAQELGVFCYRVEADYTFTYPDGTTEEFTTKSNIGCIEQRPSVYIPNAIAPTGTNNEFKPLIVFGDPSNYKMQIFTRWGELIFESYELENGWFGTNNGTLVPTGGYPYVISFTASDGANIQKKGIVTVIR